MKHIEAAIKKLGMYFDGNRVRVSVPANYHPQRAATRSTLPSTARATRSVSLAVTRLVASSSSHMVSPTVVPPSAFLASAP